MTTDNDLQRALDLSAEDARPLVKLQDGNQYEMRVPGDFSIVEQTVIQRHWRVIQRITEGEGDLTEAEATALTEGFDRMTAMLLPDVPPAVRAGLSNRQKTRLLEFFQSFIQATAPDKSPPPAGPPTSRPSNGSTAAPRRRG